MPSTTPPHPRAARPRRRCWPPPPSSPPASAEYLDAAITRLSRPDPTDLPQDQRRTYLQRRHDALVTLAKSALDRDELPAKHGPSTTGLVLIDHATLTHGDGHGRLAAELGINGPIDATTARAMLCDAGIARVLIHGRSHVLDLGRTQRTCTDAQRAAVYARDRTWPAGRSPSTPKTLTPRPPAAPRPGGEA